MGEEYANAIKSDFTEDDLVMGDVRVDMFIHEIESMDVATERLAAFMAIVDEYPEDFLNLAEECK